MLKRITKSNFLAVLLNMDWKGIYNYVNKGVSSSLHLSIITINGLIYSNYRVISFHFNLVINTIKYFFHFARYVTLRCKNP